MNKKYKKVYFKWADTTSPSEKSWWTPEDAINWAENDSYWVEQLGFLIKRTKTYILICSHINITYSEGEIIQLGQLLKVPTTWIKDFKIIK